MTDKPTVFVVMHDNCYTGYTVTHYDCVFFTIETAEKHVILKNKSRESDNIFYYFYPLFVEDSQDDIL